MIFRRLRAQGVLALNGRNGGLIGMYNPRALYPVVDDKLLTKRLAARHGVPVPELYGELRTPHDVRRLPEIVAQQPAFVIKPASGSGGDGILVIDSHRNGRYRTCSGVLLDEDDISHHVANALNGQYSLGGHPDRVMVEYRVRFDPLFDRVCYQGVPDIRIIVFLGYPVMSMVRLPTRASDGKANLHQGAVGAGICLATGRTIGGVLGDRRVREHPDTGEPVVGIEIPGWDRILEMASSCYEMTGLGYLGVDLVLDAELGPLMLELNARPGLNIQIANGEGLVPRLEHIRAIREQAHGPAQRVALMRDYFASRVSAAA
jgi:alpha-L-glutamate ligase-like protein